MNPEAIFDDYQMQENGLLTRRRLLRGAALGLGAAAVTVPATAKASVSALMCPPKKGSFGGGSGSIPPGGGGFVDGDEDYSAEVPDDGPGERRLTIISVCTCIR